MSEVQQIITEQQAELASIDANGELTYEAKEARKQAVREVYQREYAEAKVAEQEKLQRDLESSKSAVYRVPTEPHASQAERVQTQAAFRSTWRDVEFETSGEEADVAGTLTSLLDYSETFGDELMAAAVYRRAVQIEEQQDPNLHEAFKADVSPIIERYHAAHPDAARSYERYVKARGAIASANSLENTLARGLTDSMFR